MTAAAVTPRAQFPDREMDERVRSFAWDRTPIGSIPGWPESLRTFLRVLLASPKPMALWWGDSQTTFYNDAARAVLGARHPGALGTSAPSVWGDDWRVVSGTANAPRYLVVERDGARFHYSVARTCIPDERGATWGMLCEFADETPVAANAARLALLNDVERRTSEARSWTDVAEQTLAAIEANTCGLNFALVYSLDALRSRLSMSGVVGLPSDSELVPPALPFDGNEVWRTGRALREGLIDELSDIAPTLDNVPGLSERRTQGAFVVPISLMKGEPVAAMIVGVDVTYALDAAAREFIDRLGSAVTSAAARASLYQSRLAFESMASAAPAAIFAKDLDGRYAYVNSMARQMLGHRHVVGRTDEELLPPAVAARLREQDRRVIETNGSVQREAHIGDRSMLLIKFPWTDPRGGVTGVYGVAIDVSERRRIEETLQRSEQLYRAIGESIDYGVWVCDAEGRNIYASDSFLKLTGLTQQQCSDSGWTNVLHPDDVDATLAAWRECVESGSLWDREHRFRGVDGAYHHMLARGVPVRDASGKITRWVGINLDISHQKEAEERLRDADRRKDQFVAMLAHELRNPLASIRNSVHVMRLGGGDSAVESKSLDVISRQVTTLVRLVEDLLDIGRITHGKLALQMELVELSRIVEDAVETARPEIEAAHHEIDVVLPDEPVPLTADPVRLTQVIANLLSNSAKYTPPRGQIRVTAQRARDGVEVSVEDNGVGIAPELQRTVFEMFSQFHGRGMGATAGLGIGLALVKDLVDMHGGTVRATSGGFGKGSKFSIWLPATAVAGTGVAENALQDAETGAPTTQRRRVLVVDDNTDAAESMSALLTLLGHDAKVAHDGQQAVDLASSFEPELILMDIGMPGMDGLEATARIRQLPLTKQPVVIAVTGWNQDSAAVESRKAGIDRHIVKPIDLDTLVRVLRALEL
jgi:PAS domain S-box-containing protein